MTAVLASRQREMSDTGNLKVVIAGGGIAAAEAMLALNDLAGGRLDVEVIAPNRALRVPALAVGEPFGLSPPAALELADLCRDANATLRRDTLVSVNGVGRTARTGAGDEVPFDALLIAVGATPHEALPGALTYRGPRDNEEIRKVLDEALRAQGSRLLFAIPESIQWPLPVYELAMFAATELENEGIEAEVTLVTHETAPLSAFGPRASSGVRELLETLEIELLTGARPAAVSGAGLTLHDGRVLIADRVIAGPRLRVDPIPGIPQGPDGFIGTDPSMRVEGTPRVYAAGDATWFPIKQGGIGTQQADVAASAIAALANPDVRIETFRPTLRGVLFTGAGGPPRYLRTEIGRRIEASVESVAPLWWPPAKVAGDHLAPYLAKQGIGPQLQDLEPVPGHPPAESEAEQREAYELALTAAEVDADSRDYRAAVRWLDVAEQISLALPDEYSEKRRRWAARADA